MHRHVARFAKRLSTYPSPCQPPIKMHLIPYSQFVSIHSGLSYSENGSAAVIHPDHLQHLTEDPHNRLLLIAAAVRQSDAQFRKQRRIRVGKFPAHQVVQRIPENRDNIQILLPFPGNRKDNPPRRPALPSSSAENQNHPALCPGFYQNHA